MKRYTNLYEKIITTENLKLAHKNASKGKKHYKAVIYVEEHLEECINELQNLLKNKTFTTSKYDVNIISDKGKERVIHKLPYFPDRILHHAILQVVGDIWVKTFIKDTYQSIKGRGVHKCKRKLEKIAKDKNIDKLYCFKIDITKFYPSVDNNIMKSIIRKKIKCKDTLWLLDDIIDSSEGLPIGNYISQHLGNLYLSYFDHEMKEKYKCKWYFRYCDDIVILSEDKQYLNDIKNIIFNGINELNLNIKDNHQLFLVDKRPIDFLGFCFYRDKTLLRKNIKTNFKSCSYKRNVLYSYYGWMKHCNGYNLWKSKFKGVKNESTK